jgi:ABC-2 type transport system permease protein
MPTAIQMVTHLITARYFIVILKGIYMKGIGVKILWAEGIFLVIFAVLITLLSNARFKKKLV